MGVARLLLDGGEIKHFIKMRCINMDTSHTLNSSCFRWPIYSMRSCDGPLFEAGRVRRRPWLQSGCPEDALLGLSEKDIYDMQCLVYAYIHKHCIFILTPFRPVRP